MIYVSRKKLDEWNHWLSFFTQKIQVLALSYYPSRNNVIISAGENHMLVWTLQKDKETGTDLILKKRQGLFTKKIPRPKSVTCLAFALNTDEILTGVI